MVVSVTVFLFYYYCVVMVASIANALQNQGISPATQPATKHEPDLQPVPIFQRQAPSVGLLPLSAP